MTIAIADIYEQLQREMNGEVLRDEPMAAHTTWRVGGAAELFLVPEDFADLERALQKSENSQWIIISSMKVA